jgi:hypothetical protein
MPFIFHLSFPFKKHVENSIRGVKRAARRHFKWIDADLLITKADPKCPHVDHPEHGPGDVCRGHVVWTHWDRPMIRDGFFDPLKRLDPRMRVRDMTLDEVLRLRTKDDYRIHGVAVLFRVCAAQNIGAYVEPKDDVRFEQDWPWVYLKGLARLRRVRFRSRTIRNFPTRGAGVRRARAARRNGVRARTIRG